MLLYDEIHHFFFTQWHWILINLEQFTLRWCIIFFSYLFIKNIECFETFSVCPFIVIWTVLFFVNIISMPTNVWFFSLFTVILPNCVSILSTIQSTTFGSIWDILLSSTYQHIMHYSPLTILLVTHGLSLKKDVLDNS